MTKSDLSSLVIFDGVCNLCHGAVRFIIARDPKAVFQFVALQTPIAQALLAKASISPLAAQADTVYLIKDGEVFIKSEAAIEIAKSLTGYWPWLRVLRWLPLGLRDWGYDFIARNRYRLFGQRPLCLMPDDETKSRFVE
ncbi:DCC1-like thiol-disulfide oxidoreductase family protein [Shewanella psychrotolerans]|nr:DCC1-like thiol-disulfide oxidoreductase family protein [Shewanella psychrotolerans]